MIGGTKNMKKTILCLVMAAVMTVGMSIGVCAASNSSKGTVEFDGKKINSYNVDELYDGIFNLLPGDSMDIEIDVKNSSGKEADWYMKNSIINSLESNSTAKGGAYEYHLRYVSYKDNKETSTDLFSSDVVGGEGSQNEGVGLEQATNALEDYFYLERLKPGENGAVRLTVKLDGETQGNDYQGTNADLQMEFAVEEVEAEVKYEPGDPVKKTEIQSVAKTPKTGDSTKIIGISAVALVSGLIVLYFAISSIKKKGKDKKGEQ